jgi:hypothetical protein
VLLKTICMCALLYFYTNDMFTAESHVYVLTLYCTVREFKSYICSVFMVYIISSWSPLVRGVRGEESSLYSTSLAAVRVGIDGSYLNNMLFH